MRRAASAGSHVQGDRPADAAAGTGDDDLVPRHDAAAEGSGAVPRRGHMDSVPTSVVSFLKCRAARVSSVAHEAPAFLLEFSNSSQKIKELHLKSNNLRRNGPSPAHVHHKTIEFHYDAQI